MAVKVRMGEKEILQAMKQAVVMVMLDSEDQEEEGSSSDDEEDGSEDDADQENTTDCKPQVISCKKLCAMYSSVAHLEPAAAYMLLHTCLSTATQHMVLRHV